MSIIWGREGNSDARLISVSITVIVAKKGKQYIQKDRVCTDIRVISDPRRRATQTAVYTRRWQPQ